MNGTFRASIGQCCRQSCTTRSHRQLASFLRKARPHLFREFSSCLTPFREVPRQHLLPIDKALAVFTPRTNGTSRQRGTLPFFRTRRLRPHSQSGCPHGRRGRLEARFGSSTPSGQEIRAGHDVQWSYAIWQVRLGKLRSKVLFPKPLVLPERSQPSPLT